MDIKETKEYDRLLNLIGAKTVEEILKKDDSQLKELIVAKSVEINSVKEEVASTPELVRAKEVVKEFSAALRDRIKIDQAVLALSTTELKLRKKSGSK